MVPGLIGGAAVSAASAVSAPSKIPVAGEPLHVLVLAGIVYTVGSSYTDENMAQTLTIRLVIASQCHQR